MQRFPRADQNDVNMLASRISTTDFENSALPVEASPFGMGRSARTTKTLSPANLFSKDKNRGLGSELTNDQGSSVVRRLWSRVSDRRSVSCQLLVVDDRRSCWSWVVSRWLPALLEPACRSWLVCRGGVNRTDFILDTDMAP